MPAIHTETQPGGDAPSPFQALNPGKFGSPGGFQRKALKYMALFLALAVVYSVYIKTSYDRSCPTAAQITVVDLKFMLTILKFFLITGWPIVVLACLDTSWRGQDSAYASLFAYGATNVFWIHKFGGGYCPYCVIFGLVGYTFGAGLAHGLGLVLRSVSLPGKKIVLAGSLAAFMAVQSFYLLRPNKIPAPSTPVVNVAPVADYSATAQKAAGTPHFWQLDPRGGFANGGRDYCGPVAVSDSLVYLGNHGFPGLLSGSGELAQIAMINDLASPRYLGTDPNAGTEPSLVLRGIENYVVSRGYQCTTMEYKGISRLREREAEFVVADKPDLDWMKKGVLDPHGTVWLIVGWYSPTGNGQLKRFGGHWVTMVGFDAKDPDALLIHNPGTQGNGNQPDDPAQDVIHLRPIRAGTLVTGFGPDLDASGRYTISGPGLATDPGHVAVLDGAIVAVVSKL